MNHSSSHIPSHFINIVTTDTAAVWLDCSTSDTAAVSVACYTLTAAELSQFVLSRSFKQSQWLWYRQDGTITS